MSKYQGNHWAESSEGNQTQLLPARVAAGANQSQSPAPHLGNQPPDQVSLTCLTLPTKEESIEARVQGFNFSSLPSDGHVQSLRFAIADLANAQLQQETS